jgi:crossover junction endodeoxyribonuclease RusA
VDDADKRTRGGSMRSTRWKEVVATAALAGGIRPLEGPVALDVLLILPRPARHYRGRKRELAPDAPAWPTVKPDALKLCRAVEDALTGIAYRDDAQIVEERIRKVYAADGRTGAVVWIVPVSGGPPTLR